MSAVVKIVEKAVDTVVKTVEAVIKDPLPTLLVIAGQAVGIPAPITQAAITAARGGDLEDIAKSAAIAYATPAVAAKIAPAVGTAVSSVVTNEAAAKALTAATSQSLVAGSMTAATGGDWQQAAAGSFAGSMAASGYDKYVAPEVTAQAKSLGLSAESHANIQNALKSSVASGTGAAATGGDFVSSFTNAFIESGFETLSAKANEGLQDMKKSFLDDKGIQDNQPTRAGIPDDLVPEVPESNEGKLAQKRTPSIEDQLAEIEKLPRDPEYGRQYGEALATNETKVYLTPSDGDLSRYDFVRNIPASIMASPDGELGNVEVIGKSITDQDLKKAAITGDKNLLKELTEFGKISPMGDDFAPDTETLSSRDLNRILSQADQSSAAAVEAKAQASINPTPENIATAEQAKLTAELDQKALQSETQTAAEDFGLKAEAGYLTPKDIGRIISNADESATAAVEAKLAASVNPTPENIAVAEQAQLTAELDQKVLDDAQKQSFAEGFPVTGEVPPQSTTAPVTGEVPVQSANVSAPTTDQTNQRILYSILSGNATTGAPTPVAGQAGADASGLSGLQQAGIADVQGAGGISDPIDSQTGKIGTLTGGTKMPGTGGVGLSLNAPSGGLQFSNFARSGYVPQQGNLVGSLIPNLLSELNNQSLMMMSPEEYALRTQAGNIFRVARGGLITLKKQR
jgi:hypothetical protein